MTDPDQVKLPSRQELAFERTQLASVRTEFALMRTGFTIASFGAGVTQLLGRNVWPVWATNGLTLLFVLTGMVCVIVGALAFRRRTKELGHDLGMSPFAFKALLIIPWAILVLLLGLLILMLLA